MKDSLDNRLVRWFKKRPGEYIAKEKIIEFVKSKTKYSSEYIGRKLRYLCEDGRLDVKYRGPSKHAHYGFIGGKSFEEQDEEFWRSL